jgi:hypothetical protein
LRVVDTTGYRWAQIDKNLDDDAARRPTETAAVVLEPRDASDPDA